MAGKCESWSKRVQGSRNKVRAEQERRDCIGIMCSQIFMSLYWCLLPPASQWSFSQVRLIGKHLPYITPTLLCMCPFSPLLNLFPQWLQGMDQGCSVASWGSCPGDHACNVCPPLCSFSIINIDKPANYDDSKIMFLPFRWSAELYVAKFLALKSLFFKMLLIKPWWKFPNFVTDL